MQILQLLDHCHYTVSDYRLNELSNVNKLRDCKLQS
jgi:hypothetical protein